MASNLCPVRCFCGQEVQSKYSVYCQKIREGKSMKEALDTCGLPMSSAFAPPIGFKNSYLTPPSICCRAMLMCNSDLSTQHNIYQSIVRWAEGDSAVGVSNAKQQHQHYQQQQQHQQASNNKTSSASSSSASLDAGKSSAEFTPAHAANSAANAPKRHRVSFATS